MPKRKRLNANQKAQIAIEILKEEKTISQIASEFGVHPNMLFLVKKQTLGNLPIIFEDENKGERDRQGSIKDCRLWHRYGDGSYSLC